VTIIWPCGLGVEEYAAAGKEVVVPRQCCPRCGLLTMFWSGYFRSVRSGAVFRIWVKRCRCCRCHSSDALLPSFCLVGRLDAVEVIGPALKAVSCGAGTRRVAAGIGELFAYTTLRGWWRRHQQRGAWLWSVLSAARAWCVGRCWGGSDADALEALESVGAAVAAVAGVGSWPAVSLVLGGAWLSTTTDTPTTAGVGGSLMTLMAGRDLQVPP